MEHVLNILAEPLLETGKHGSVRNLVESAEIAQFLGIAQKEKQKAVCGDGENALDNKCPYEAVQPIPAGPSCPRMIVLFERKRDVSIDIDVVLKQRKEFGFIVFHDIKTVGIDVG
jgi:hypothetical protein